MGSSVVSFANELLLTADESLVQPDTAIAINEKKKYFILIRFSPFSE
ncbi:hypothetical protein [Psychrobacillus sp. FSL K6-1464]